MTIEIKDLTTILACQEAGITPQEWDALVDQAKNIELKGTVIPSVGPFIMAARLDETKEPVKIMVRCDNDEEKCLYTFFSDEKSYQPQSFVGMTYAAAQQRVLDDDAKYLTSPQRFMAF